MSEERARIIFLPVARGWTTDNAVLRRVVDRNRDPEGAAVVSHEWVYESVVSTAVVPLDGYRISIVN